MSIVFVYAICRMCALLQVVLEVVQDTQFIKGLGTVCRVFSERQLFQLQGSAPQQSEAILMERSEKRHV